MKLAILFGKPGIPAILAAAILALAPATWGQGNPSNTQQQTQQPAQQQTTPPATNPTNPTTPPAAGTPSANPMPTTPVSTEVPKIDPAEESAYKAFTDLKPDEKDAQAPNSGDADRAKQIDLGEAFLTKYPSSKYDLRVYSQLVQDYYHKNDLEKMYGSADKALALDPDDVAVLVLVGWVIPHSTSANTPEGSQRLDKAEQYEKHALSVLPMLPKPADLDDQAFSKVKIQAQSEAHSALGLIYFRRNDFPNSIAELQQGTSTAMSPDPTDYYVMGRELQALKRSSEAVDAYQKCSAIAGPLQNACKQYLDQAKKEAAETPAAPKQ
jgi:tetratricopeptide (TPR) repeat protein